MQIKTTIRYCLIPIRKTTVKKQKITSVDKDVERLERLCTVDGKAKWNAAMKNSIAVPQKIRNGITM